MLLRALLYRGGKIGKGGTEGKGAGLLQGLIKGRNGVAKLLVSAAGVAKPRLKDASPDLIQLIRRERDRFGRI